MKIKEMIHHLKLMMKKKYLRIKLMRIKILKLKIIKFNQVTLKNLHYKIGKLIVGKNYFNKWMKVMSSDIFNFFF
jgi:hypothetical protein